MKTVTLRYALDNPENGISPEIVILRKKDNVQLMILDTQFAEGKDFSDVEKFVSSLFGIKVKDFAICQIWSLEEVTFHDEDKPDKSLTIGQVAIDLKEGKANGSLYFSTFKLNPTGGFEVYLEDCEVKIQLEDQIDEIQLPGIDEPIYFNTFGGRFCAMKTSKDRVVITNFTE